MPQAARRSARRLACTAGPAGKLAPEVMVIGWIASWAAGRGVVTDSCPSAAATACALSPVSTASVPCKPRIPCAVTRARDNFVAWSMIARGEGSR